ncbi:MAG: class F sortase [Propionibacteriaceae bacterium]|jgi:hypothetical protein|nr:class F sortase [Propionibacteriaceae bacterium]
MSVDTSRALDEEQEEERRRSNWPFRILMILAVLLIATSVSMFAMDAFYTPEGTYRDMAGNLVQPENPEDLTPEAIEAMDVEPMEGRFQVPAVGLDAPLKKMNMVNNVINPPGFQEVYWIRNLGVSVQEASQGTSYFAAHSLRRGAIGPGNYLIDVEAAEGKVPIGSDMYIDSVKYVVTEVRKVEKKKIKNESDIWQQDIPNRAIVVTCLQRPNNGASVYNIVVIGMLADAVAPVQGEDSNGG